MINLLEIEIGSNLMMLLIVIVIAAMLCVLAISDWKINKD